MSWLSRTRTENVPMHGGSGVRHPRQLSSFGALGACSGLLVVAVLTSLSLGGASAQAAFPGTNGKIACYGIKERTLLPDPSEDDYEVYTLNPDGSDLTYLTDNLVREPTDPTDFYNDDTNPVWSPDGKTIAFAGQRSGNVEVYTMNPDGTNVKRLTFAIAADTPHGWSPDGRTIYFHSSRDRNQEIYSMNADGSNQTRLTDNPANDSVPTASPDGTKIIFASNRDSNDVELYTMNPDGSNQTRLTESPGSDTRPDWSPDGGEIIWSSQRTFVTGSTTARDAEIYKMNADGTEIVRLTDNSTNDPTTALNESLDQNPAWSPDGTKIVFDSNRSGDQEVYTMNADGSGVTRLTDAASVDAGCDWQPIPRQAAPGPGGPGPGPGPVSPAAPFEDCPNLTANVIRGSAAGGSITGTPGVTGSSAARVMTWWMLWRATTASIWARGPTRARAAWVMI